MLCVSHESVSKRMEKNDNIHFWCFDVLKVLLAIIVVLRHCAQSFCAAGSLFYILIVNIISPVAVPAFFAISGFLLFRKPISFQRLVRQVKRILKLYVIWSVIYLPLTAYLALKSPGTPAWRMILTYFQNFLFSGSHYHLWFLPALAFGLLLVWFLDKYVKRWIQVIAVALLFIVGTVVENFAFLLPDPVLRVCNLYNRIFLTTRNGLFFGGLFVWIGKFFSEIYGSFTADRLKKFCAVMLIAAVGLIGEGLLLSKIHESFVVNMMFTTVPFVLALLPLAILLSISKQCKHGTKYFREASTFLFCVHPIVIIAVTFIEKIGIQLPGMFSVVAVVFLCMAATFLYSKLASKIRILQNLV